MVKLLTPCLHTWAKAQIQVLGNNGLIPETQLENFTLAVIIRSINKQKADTNSTRALVLEWSWRWSRKKLLPAHNGDAMLYALLYLHLRILATLSLYFFFLLLLFFFLKDLVSIFLVLV